MLNKDKENVDFGMVLLSMEESAGLNSFSVLILRIVLALSGVLTGRPSNRDSEVKFLLLFHKPHESRGESSLMTLSKRRKRTGNVQGREKRQLK